MKSLQMLQQQFQHYLLQQDSQINEQIIATEKVSVATRLNIYGHAYRARLVEALAANYPLLYRYLGDEQFAKLSNIYLTQTPSTFRSIRWFGKELPALVKKLYGHHAYLESLANIEWTLTEVFDAQDATPVTLADMAAIAPEDWSAIRLQFHPSLRLLTFSYSILPFWKALAEDQDPVIPEACPAFTCLFWRKDLINQFSALSEDEAWAIQTMINNGEFGALCAGLCQWMGEEDAVMRAASLLKSWISSGLIVKVVLD